MKSMVGSIGHGVKTDWSIDMAIKAAEAWVSSDGRTVAVKTNKGGYNYYVSDALVVNRKPLCNHQFIQMKITELNLEIIEAKK